MIRYILAALLLASPAWAQTGNLSGASVTAAGGGQTNTLANWLQGISISTVNKTLAGTWTANSFIPSSATIPADGFYKPALNTLGWSINSAGEMQLTSSALSPAVANGNALGTTSLPWGGLTVGNASSVALLTHSTYFAPSGGAMVSSMKSSGNAFGTLTTGGLPMRAFNIDSDTVDATGATGRGVTGTYVGHTVSAGAVGGRTALFSFMNVSGAVTAFGTGEGKFHVSSGAFAQASASAGGASGAGNARGNLFGSNFSARLLSGAGLYWESVVGGEANIGTPTGTAATRKIGFQVVPWSDDAVSGTLGMDVGYGLVSQPGTSPGLDRGYNFGDPNGYWPIKSTGTMIGTLVTYPAGPAYTAAYGVDFSAVTFSSAFLKSTGFSVDGDGDTLAKTVATGAAALTLTTGAIGLSKMTASASAPGAAGGKIELVCGTNAGTAKLVAYAGTSGTAVTILDNIGGGVTGC